MGDDNTEVKKRKAKWATPYSKVTQAEAEKRLGVRIENLKAVTVTRMLEEAGYEAEGMDRDKLLKTKEKVYNGIVQYIDTEGYPMEDTTDFNESNINDLVFAILSPIISDFRRSTGRWVRLRREMVLASVDSETGGEEEFVVVDLVSVTDQKFVLMVEAKRSSLGKAMKQCLLTMRDMRENNGSGVVYGFVTVGESWRMIRYDGESFQKTLKMDVMYDTMGEQGEKDVWMNKYSDVVDCIWFALSDGGIVQEKEVDG